MKILEIQGKTGHSKILVGESLNHFERYIPKGKCVIITDQNVNSLYGDAFTDYDVIEIGTGEKVKTLKTVEDIFAKLVEFEVDRSGFVLGVGGGIVCDISGFVASTYMRGIRFGFVSTTLLAQVDASVGGKNGVNFSGYKNMVGTFNQPEFVICDMALLKTLPEREVLCGFGEIAKHAFIGDMALCDFLEQNHKKAIALDADVIARLVYDSVVIKSGVVNRDEKEKGERKKLNFGHTFGHAIEKTAGLLHGEAISIGMVVAARLSQKKGLLSNEDVERIITLLQKLTLPVNIDADRNILIDAMRKDKKRKGDDIDFVLLNGIGNAIIKGISIAELEKVVGHL
ncbi:MAG: 3-dehydroquinate synthase [Proteobacteria bacterium]|nr:3-dehydroquinate synthase [Pseudomonadota bacterium]